MLIGDFKVKCTLPISVIIGDRRVPCFVSLRKVGVSSLGTNYLAPLCVGVPVDFTLELRLGVYNRQTQMRSRFLL